MIEGEEVLESAQETGYRLCVSKENNEDDFSKIFSCCWDPNNRNRLFICSQNGSLRVYNLNNSSHTDYSVQFRRFTDAETKEESKTINYHWDKLVAIPDRPDELIFLLGVSKSLLYTALPGAVPYPEQPFIAKSTRGDFTGYIYGTPVMELWTHIARVTAVAVSSSGQILASGDEQGHLKLLMLRLIDNIIPTTSNAAKRASVIGFGKNRGRAAHADPEASSASASKAVPQFSPFLPDYKCTLQAHSGGPIFSLSWLPMPLHPAEGSLDEDQMSDLDANIGVAGKRSRSYALATGSADRAVRIWGVTCSATLGLNVHPIMVLDTLSTHVLSLGSFLSTVREGSRVIDSRASFTSSLFGSVSSGLGHSTSIVPEENTWVISDKGVNRKGQLKFRTGGGASVYLAAGTNIGAIYVWEIPTALLFALTVKTRQAKLVDDGSLLHSLVQSATRPVVSLSLSLARNPDPLARKVYNDVPSIVLAASDTAGCVRTHRPCEEEVRDQSVPSSLRDSRLATRGSKFPITVCGEAFYPNGMVVGCAFQEHEDNTNYQAPADTWTVQHLQDRRERTTGEEEQPSRVKWHASRLLIATTAGAVHVVDTDQAVYPIASKLSELENAASASASPVTGRSTEAGNRLRGPTSSVALPAPPVLQELRRSAGSASKASVSRLQVDTDFDDGSRAIPTSSQLAEGAAKTARKGDPVSLKLAPPAHIRFSEMLEVENRVNAGSDSDDSALPRNAAPAAAGALYNSIDAGQTPRLRLLKTPQSLDQAPLFTSPTASAEARFHLPIPEAEPVAPSPSSSVPDVEITRGARRGVPRVSYVSTARSDASVSDATPDDVADDYEEDISPPPPPATAPPAPASTLATAQAFSSKALQSRMLALKQKIDRITSAGSALDDELSIGTFETTESDRAAGRRAVALALNHVPMHLPRYEDQAALTSLLDLHDPALYTVDGRKPAVVRKSSDPAWLHRKRTGGPTAHDLQSLFVPDPLVRLALASRGSIGERGHCVGGAHDLSCQASGASDYQPVFQNRILPEQVFGDWTGASAAGEMTHAGRYWDVDSEFMERCYNQDVHRLVSMR